MCSLRNQFLNGLVLLCLICAAAATIDFSNANLANFQFFRYPKHPVSMYPVAPEPGLKGYIDKTKAVLEYSRNVLIGKPVNNQQFTFRFDPEFGKRWAPEFQRHYGYRGENLIALLGSGRSFKELAYYGVINHKNNPAKYQ